MVIVTNNTSRKLRNSHLRCCVYDPDITSHCFRIFWKEQLKMGIGNFILVLVIWYTPTILCDCQTSFGVTACYGVRISLSPPECPGPVVRINSPRTTLNLSTCPSTDVLTLIYDKECSTLVLAARPIKTFPPDCVSAVVPQRYRILVSCFCLKTILLYTELKIRSKLFRLSQLPLGVIPGASFLEKVGGADSKLA